MSFVGYLGGESGHRGFFGGTGGKTRTVLLVVSFLVMLVTTPFLGLPGLLLGVVLAGVSFAVTQRTNRGSVLQRITQRRRWNQRRKQGTDRFTPYDVAVWDQAEQELFDLHKARGRDAKQRRAALRAELAALRANPDGSDGMGWLQSAVGVPGIAWHTPLGEPAYLSVSFLVSGPLRGIESAASVNRVTEHFSRFTAARASSKSLVSGVQITARILAADTALHEDWVMQALDADAPIEAMRSYEEVIYRSGKDAMVQRHYVTLSWPLTPAFISQAARYGQGRDGWRALMAIEIENTLRGLKHAELTPAAAMSARQTVAVIRNQQNPDWPVDMVAGLSPAALGLPSRDEWSAHVVQAQNPLTGHDVEWWHRTAAIRAENLATVGRKPTWQLELLRGGEIDCIRTISYHLNLVPAKAAKARATSDYVKDEAAAIANDQKGRLADDEIATRATAARRRRTDLAPGTGHQGVDWIGFITVTADSRDSLAEACRDLTDVADTSAGIEHLEWLDSYQSAASGTTWPIGRGLGPSKEDAVSRFADALAGKGAKEELV